MSHVGRQQFAPRLLTAVLLLGALPVVASADENKKPPADPAPARPKKEDLERDAAEQFTKHDRNGDGTLRGAEVPKGWAEGYDCNGDGAVTRSEYVDVRSRPAKLRRLHGMRDPRQRAAESLQSFDRNKDGIVQREEYPGRDDVFRGADRNKNGALEAPELLALADEEIEDIRRKMKSPSRNEFLSLFDADRDNKVDADEYDGPAAPFRKFDTDGDGVVTYDELYPERMMDRERSEKSAPKPEPVSVIGALDKDGDGKVARAEFAGNDTAWRRLDVNGDGWITSADAR